jgi:UDP-2,3-diacylglucosamine pyrophosphatase LpxH
VSLPNKRYQTRVNKALTKALEKTRHNGDVVELDLQNDKWVIFSDHHRGTRDGADDFSESEDVYHAALGYYFEKGYHLAVLGDVEELWENKPKPVIEKNRETLELEREFHNENRYYRFWGNHDDDWSESKRVDKHFREFPDLNVRESMLIVARNGDEKIGEFLLVHGHQGTLFSDRLRWLGRFGVLNFWRPFQRLFKIRLNTPAKDWGLRQEHNIALYNWAVNQKELVLIAGHTHRPVFDTCTQIEKLKEELKEARKGGDPQKIAIARAELEYERVKVGRSGFMTSQLDLCQPCYFNTGCCSFDDGDITGLEIDGPENCIRLVRWPDNQGERLPEELAKADLTDVFDELRLSGKPVSLAQ